ncbi:zinc-binding dehydrogenase [Agromyces bauzanensis]
MPTSTRELPRTMRAAVLHDEEPHLRVIDVEVPVPQRGEALVEVIACGVCHTDLHVMKGEVAFPRPAVLGHEISGVVVGFGPGTDVPEGLEVGATVVGAFIMPCTECDACRRGRDDLCANFFAQNRLRGTLYDGTSRLAMPDGSFLAMYSMGGLAEYSVVPVSALSPLSDATDAATACIAGCAGLTSYGAVVRAGHVAAGDAVVVVGVGGVGSSIVQMAAAVGATRIVAVDIADEKLERARQLGATDAVNSREVDPVEAVRGILGDGADVAFEALGRPETFVQASKMLADGGRMVAVGIAAGAATAPIEITPLVRRGYTITGSFGGRTRADLPAVVDLVESGAFDAAGLITRRFSLEQADEAYQALARGEITGRAIVVMGIDRRDGG